MLKIRPEGGFFSTKYNFSRLLEPYIHLFNHFNISSGCSPKYW